jgi:hypothetical protein
MSYSVLLADLRSEANENTNTGYLPSSGSENANKDQCTELFNSILSDVPTIKVDGMLVKISPFQNFMNEISKLIFGKDYVPKIGGGYEARLIAPYDRIQRINQQLTSIDGIINICKMSNAEKKSLIELKSKLETAKAEAEKELKNPSSRRNAQRVQAQINFNSKSFPRVFPSNLSGSKKIVTPQAQKITDAENAGINQNPHLLHNVMSRNINSTAVFIGGAAASIWAVFQGSSKATPNF